MRQLTDGVRGASQAQADSSPGAERAIGAVTTTVSNVHDAQVALANDSHRVATAIHAIASVSRDQDGLVGELEAVIGALQELTRQLEVQMQRFKT